jgi:hypothetical protein
MRAWCAWATLLLSGPVAAAQRLAIPAPAPDAGPVLRDVVWPALRALAPTAGWTPEPAATAVDEPAVAARRLGAQGVLWATDGPDGPVLHLYRRPEDRVLDAPVPIPADADAASAREAVRLRAEFLLEAPAAAGRPAPPAAGRALPPIPPDRLGDLMTPAPAPPPPLPPAVVPEPPALPPAPPGAQVQVEVTASPGAQAPDHVFSRTAEGAVTAAEPEAAAPAAPVQGLRLRLGPVVLADAQHAEPGLQAASSWVPGPTWGGRLDAALFPWREEAGDRLTTLRLAVSVVFARPFGRWRAALSAGPFYEAGFGAENAARAGLTAGASLALPLAGPFELGADAAFDASPTALRVAGLGQDRLQALIGLHLAARLSP